MTVILLAFAWLVGGTAALCLLLAALAYLPYLLAGLSSLLKDARVYLRCLRRRTRRWRRDPVMPVWVVRLATRRKRRKWKRSHPAVIDVHEKCSLTPGERDELAAMEKGLR